jgi:hypothetical protein
MFFLTTLCVGLALFFYFGNSQRFLDSTQDLILSVLSGVSIITVLLVLVQLVMAILFSVLERTKRYLPIIAGCIPCFGLAAFCAVLSRIIRLLADGF